MPKIDKEEIGKSYIKDFPLMIIQLAVGKGKTIDDQLSANTDLSLFQRLKLIGDELHRLEVNSIYAGYQVGKIHHSPEKISPTEREAIKQARAEVKQHIQSQQAVYRNKATSFLKSENKPLEEIDLQYADLSTDGAFSGLSAAEKLDKKTNFEFYEASLESYKDTARTSRDYILLFTLPNQFKDTTTAEISLSLRKFSAGGYKRIVQACLEHGGDPYEQGKSSSLNAFDRAKKDNHDDVLEVLDTHVKKEMNNSPNK